MDNRKFLRFLTVAVLFLGLSASALKLSFAEVGPSDEISAAKKKIVTEFLAKNNHPDMDIKSGSETVIQNGFFLKVEGADKKTSKIYAIELIAVPDYSTLILLSIKEKTAQDSSYNKK